MPTDELETETPELSDAQLALIAGREDITQSHRGVKLLPRLATMLTTRRSALLAIERSAGTLLGATGKPPQAQASAQERRLSQNAGRRMRFLLSGKLKSILGLPPNPSPHHPDHLPQHPHIISDED